MKRFKLSPQAAEDIYEAWAYIARDNLNAAGASDYGS
jgi:plasmid stabilization system protein ParE